LTTTNPAAESAAAAAAEDTPVLKETRAVPETTSMVEAEPPAEAENLCSRSVLTAAARGTALRDEQGEPYKMIGSISDITESKRTEAALRQSEQENALRAELLRQAPVIAAFHDRDNNIVWANQAYEEATGVLLQDIVGKKCYSVWNLSGPCQGCPVLTAIATGKPSEAELTPQNQKQWTESQGYWLSKASPVRDREGSIIGAIEVAINITERKQAEASLRETNQALLAATTPRAIFWPI